MKQHYSFNRRDAFRAPTKIILLGVMFASALSWLVAPAQAVTRNWRTDGPSQNWSNPDNWSPAGVPQNGDDLIFYEYNEFGTDPDPMINDLTNLVVNAMWFGGQTDISGDIEWTLSGNTITLSSTNGGSLAISLKGIDTETAIHINCGLKLGSDAQIRAGGCWPGSPHDICPSDGEVFRVYLNGPIDLNGYDLTLHGISIDNTIGSLRVAGDISGNGNVSVLLGQNSEVIINSPSGNSFNGTLTINDSPGSLTLFDVPSGVVVADTLVLHSLGSVKLARPDQIGDNATVLIYSGSVLQLDGHDDTIGFLELFNSSGDTLPSTLDTAGGTLTLNDPFALSGYNDSDSVTPAIKGRLNLASGSHTINSLGSAYAGLDIQAQIVGSGGFNKLGNSALLLQASNTFDGSISITDGILDVRNDHALGSVAGDTTLFEGALLLRNVAIGTERLTAEGQGVAGVLPGSVLTSIGLCSWAGQVLLDTNLDVTGDMTFTGDISGPGGIGCFGGGTVELGGMLENIYTGPTLVRCPLVEFGKPAGVKAFNGTLVVGSDDIVGSYEARWLNDHQHSHTTLMVYSNGVVNLNGHNEDFDDVTFNGGEVDTDAGVFAAYEPVTVNPNEARAIINGYLDLPSGLTYFNVGDGQADPDLLVNAHVTGAAGSISKQGPGTMRLASDNTYAGVTFVDEGVLQIDNGNSLGGSGSAYAVVHSNATLRLSSSSSILPEPLFLSGDGVGGTNGAIAVLNGGAWTLTGLVALDDPSSLNVGSVAGLGIANVLAGTGPLTKTGPGLLVLSGSANNTYSGDTFVTAGTLNLDKNQFVIAVPGNLILGPASPSAPAVARFYRTGEMNVSNVTVNANSLLDLNGNNQSLVGLTLNDGGDVATAAGVLSFVAGSTVQVGSLSLLGSKSGSSMSGQILLPANATLTFNVAPYSPTAPLLGLPPELDVPAVIRGDADVLGFARARVTKTGFGQMRISGNNTTFAGSANVNGGTLIVANSGALGTTQGVTAVNNSATLALALDVGIAVAGEALFINSTNVPALDSRTGANIWAGPITLNVNAAVNVNNSLLVSGVIGGSGSLTKVGPGDLDFNGSEANTYSGDTFVNRGMLTLAKSAYVQAVPHNLFIGAGLSGAPATTVRYLSHDQVWANITVNGGGLLDLNGYDEYEGPLTLNGGGSVQTGIGSLYVASGGITVNPGNNTTSTISGKLGFYAGTQTIDVGSGTTIPGTHDLVISASIFQATPSAGILKTGAGSARFTGTNSYTGTTTVGDGTLQLDGVQSHGEVEVNGGKLQGTGTVGPISLTTASAVVAPGDSPGILTCGNLDNNGGIGTLQVELNGTTPGSGYDQLNVQGSVNLIGLSLSGTLNFAAATNNQFIIINNDGSDSVFGTFTGLPQGATMNFGDRMFQITYTGGDGNDVVLTDMGAVFRPVLTIEHMLPNAVRLLWPTNDPLFSLQSNTNVATTNWVGVAPPPITVGTNNIVTNSIGDGPKFYRLRKP